VQTPLINFPGHHVPLELKPEEIIFGATNRGPPDGFHKKDAGVRHDAPADIDEPELAQRALELQGVASVFENHESSEGRF